MNLFSQSRFVQVAVGFIGIGAVMMPAGGTQTAWAQAKRGGTIVIGTPFEPRQLNHAVTTSWADHVVTSKIFNALLRFPEKGYPNPEPDLAERWSISPDGRRLTFHLVRNATWHDGKPFTSADVKFTFEQVLPKLNPNRAVFQTITKVETPDPYTVVMERTRPFVLFYFDIFSGAILPKHLYENTDVAKNPANLKPVGTGPFRFKEWVKGSHIELVRFGQYFKPGRPYLDRVIFKIVPDVGAAVAALEKGEVDYFPRWVPLGEVARLKGRAGLDVSPVGGIALAQSRWMTFNVKDPILKDVRVRQAIAYSIDTVLVNRIATGGQFEVGESFLWKQFPEFDPRFSTLARYKRDLGKARQLLDEAGQRAGVGGMRFRLELVTHTGVADLDKSIEVIRDQLREVGIEVTVKRVERALSFDLAKDGKFQLYIHSNWAAGPDPVTAVQRFFISANIGKLLGNAGSYSSPEVDELTEQALAEADPAKKKALVAKLQETFVRDLPALPLQQWVPLSGYRTEFVNVVSHSVDSRETLDDTSWTKADR
ncbi:MAG: ABC transporter substrate-binding protein [Candidatus Rokubacteria bacterium]|nr:ABC transporter substrate-binding protein [Candidatus Rokubacteria bacterium]